MVHIASDEPIEAVDQERIQSLFWSRFVTESEAQMTKFAVALGKPDHLAKVESDAANEAGRPYDCFIKELSELVLDYVVSIGVLIEFVVTFVHQVDQPGLLNLELSWEDVGLYKSWDGEGEDNRECNQWVVANLLGSKFWSSLCVNPVDVVVDEVAKDEMVEASAPNAEERTHKDLVQGMLSKLDPVKDGEWPENESESKHHTE